MDLEENALGISAVAPDLSDDACRTKELWLRRIEPGTFFMGSPADEFGRHDNETRHQVKLTKAFYIGVFEFTQQQYRGITGESPSKGTKGDTHPVEGVSYYMLRGGASWPLSKDPDEDSFLGLIRKKYQCVFDLPTEAQWEYACRAGKATAWNNGTDITDVDEDPELNKLGRYWCNRNDGKGGYNGEHTIVGSYLPNAWGLYDMHGNVHEWCLDWFGSYDGDAVDPVGATEGTWRIIRGGSFFHHAEHCRSARRMYHSPGPIFNSYGFRLVIIPKE